MYITQYAKDYASKRQTNGMHTHLNQYVNMKMWQCYRIKGYTQRRQIGKQKRENMHIDRCGNTNRQKCPTKGSKKKVKYKHLWTEIQQMWNVKCMIILVITGATRRVTKGLKKKFGGYTRKTVNKCITKDSYRLFIIHTNTSKQP